MLPPYPNNRRHHHHHHCISRQEPPPANPTDFHMSAGSLDEHVQYFPAEMYNQDTLEAVLRQPVTAPVPVEREPGTGALADGGHGGAAGAPRKRPFRTDRHSKIRTAQGVRDRRMRLSVGVARDFFALQDLLGFDKASKTVDWLLTQSKPAIERLSDAALGAAVPGPAAAGGRPVKEKGEAVSSSSNDCFWGARERARSRGSESMTERMNGTGGDRSPMVLTAERGGSELDWIMSGATVASTMEQPVHEFYQFQYYHLEEMMRATTTKDY